MVNRPSMPPRPVPVDGHIYGERSLWMKGEEAQLVKSRDLTVIIRQGARDNPNTLQWLPMFTPIPVFYIAIPGDQAKSIAAKFEPDDGTTVQIARRTVCRLHDVLEEDLQYEHGYAVPDTVNPDAEDFDNLLTVKEYLENELVPGRTFMDEDLVTIYCIEYLPSAF